MKFINNWYPIILAFGCLLYSVSYALLGMYEEGTVLCTLAGNNIVICNRYQTKKKYKMNIGFFIVGAVIFATYMGLTVYNIIYSNRKQREDNYPTIVPTGKDFNFKEYLFLNI